MLLCPQCKTLHEQPIHCPDCGERLVGRERGGGGPPFRQKRWLHTTWGRILIGILLAQGLLFGVRQVLKGLVLGFLPEGTAPGDLPQVVLLYQAAQLLTLLAACVLASGGQRSGLFLGSIIGVVSGFLGALFQPPLDTGVSPVSLIGMPVIQAVFGAVGGWVGCTFWKPLPLAAFPGQFQTKPRRGSRGIPLLKGKIAWVRVVIGIGLAVGGSLAALSIFTGGIDLTQGYLVRFYDYKDRIVIWEIKALALLFGGAFAGSNTHNGMKQGILVGLGTASTLLGLQVDQVNQVWEFSLLTAAGTFSLCLVGGWFGGQLFPPVVKDPRRHRGLGPASI